MKYVSQNSFLAPKMFCLLSFLIAAGFKPSTTSGSWCHDVRSLSDKQLMMDACYCSGVANHSICIILWTEESCAAIENPPPVSRVKLTEGDGDSKHICPSVITIRLIIRWISDERTGTHDASRPLERLKCFLFKQ